MPRPRTLKVREAKERIVARLREGFHRPGQRFLSNRAVAQTYGLSYQTAHRLMAELQAEGWLERAPGSGSFVPGAAPRLHAVELIFHGRARREGSFGAQLLALLRATLAAGGVETGVTFAETAREIPPDRLPVLWECPLPLAGEPGAGRFAILLNNRPPPGLAATMIDSLAVDDYSGGAAAAQILTSRSGRRRRLAVLAGPARDPRSQRRVEGFLDHAPKSEVVWAGSWYAEEAAAAARRVARGSHDAVFCCNDRLAAALLAACGELRRPRPAVVGFDDAPVSEALDLTTIAFPWERVAAGVLAIARARLAGDTTPATQRIFAPHPVMRRSHLGERE